MNSPSKNNYLSAIYYALNMLTDPYLLTQTSTKCKTYILKFSKLKYPYIVQ